jgi:hypothetical protein
MTHISAMIEDITGNRAIIIPGNTIAPAALYNIDAKDRYGKTAMDYALEKEDATLIRRIVRILTRYKSAG